MTGFARPGSEGVALAILLTIGGLLCGLPLLLLARVGLTVDGVATLGPMLEALGSRSVLRALTNSLDSAAWSSLFATVMGTALALAIGLTDVRAKGALVFCIMLPMMIPPHVTAIAWIQALGPSSPPLQVLGIAPPVGSTNPLYSRWGVILLLSVQHTALAFLIVRTALRTLPREMSDAARVCGAGPITMLRRVALPLLAPSLLAAFGLAFVSALGNFGIPAMLGVPARYITLPVLIWRRLSSFGPGMLTDMAVLSALIAGVAVLAVAVTLILQRRVRAALIGPPQAPLALRLGRARLGVESGLWLLVAAVLVLPLWALMATALVRVYGLPLTGETITLDHFVEVLLVQAVTARAFLNSTLVAGVASLLLATMAIGLGYFMARPRGLRRHAASGLATAAEVAYAVPGIVLSVAFILAFLRPIPVLGLTLYNTLGIILLAYMAAFFAIALKPVSAAYGQLDSGLDDAARVSGAGFSRRMRAIFAPLVAPAAASGAILVFLTAYNEITVSALLWSTGNETIGTTIFNYEDGGYTALAAAMASLTVAATVVLMLALHWFGRGLPAGVIPWRD